MDMLRRIEQLEAQQRIAFASSAGGIGKRGRFAAPLQVRLVKAITPDGESYPSAPANVFPVRFVDCDFDPADSDQTPTYTERVADVAQAHVLSLRKSNYILSGTVFPAFRIPPLEGGDGGEWFTDFTIPFWPGKADSAISKGSTGTVSLWTHNGSSMVDTNQNVTAMAWGAAITSGKIVAVHPGPNDMWFVGPWEC